MDDIHKQKLQLGRKLAYLKRCIRVNELLTLHETECSVRVRIFNRYIKPDIKMSYAQFNNMMNEHNPAKQLAEIEAQINNL